jgi:hypothetical protein
VVPVVPAIAPGDAAAGRRLVPLTWQESMRLLGTVSFGRIVFTSRAMPAIRPVNHLVDDGEIIIRTNHGSAITGEVRRVPGEALADAVVAYEADRIEEAEHLGWSVVVTGVALPVTDQSAADRYRRLLRPWIDGPRDSVIRVRPELVTGYRLTPSGDYGVASGVGFGPGSGVGSMA